MSNILDWIKSVIALNGGVMTGKTRLQKTFFFLESKGGKLGLDFDYHHYGPYSETLSAVLSFAGEDDITAREKKAGNAMPCFEFSVQGDHQAKNVGALSSGKVREILKTLADFSSWELELAATIHYFQEAEMSLEEAVEETKQRKTVKASPERLVKARELLSKLQLL